MSTHRELPWSNSEGNGPDDDDRGDCGESIPKTDETDFID
jgi:hypothetical protein